MKTSLLCFFPSLRENPDDLSRTCFGREKGEKELNKFILYMYPSPDNCRDHPNQGRTKKLKAILNKQNSLNILLIDVYTY